MGKGGTSRNRNPSRHKSINGYKRPNEEEDIVDDEIDAFHKQRDIIPLDVDGDLEGSEEDDEHPVFDFKGANYEDEDDGDEDEDGGDEDEDDEDESQLTGLAAKIARKQKDLRAKSSGVEDEMHDDSEDEGDKKIWGKGKGLYYDGDNKDYDELESSDEDAALEEELARKSQVAKVKSLREDDFGLDVSEDESDGEPTLEEIRSKVKTAPKAPWEINVHDDLGVTYEVVKKDLNALTKEEQMDAVNSSAPELVGLLSELNDAVTELENKINPLLSKVKDMGNTARGGLHYLEVKQLLLLAYCQSITFYLLLKSEGQTVRDHPVVARLVEIKYLLDKMKQLDENLPSDLEDILTKQQQIESVIKLPNDNGTLTSVSSVSDRTVPNGTAEVPVVPHEAGQVVNADCSQKNEKKRRKLKEIDEQVGIQSMEMLKVRAALEEKLKQKGLFSSITSKHEQVQKYHKLVKSQLVTLDDFDDDATDKSKENTIAKRSSKFSQLVTPQRQKSKIISGDDDLPRRDDIGERRRKHELRVLAGAGIKSTDNDNQDGDELEDFKSDEDIDMAEGGEPESEDEFYIQVKEQRAAKLAAKAELYSRTPAVTSVPEETLADGKRHISSQMEKNRGLTRPRKKLIKNPRKKYKLKHQKAVINRKGQVRDIRKPMGPYGGETSGINAGISRSIRL